VGVIGTRGDAAGSPGGPDRRCEAEACDHGAVQEQGHDHGDRLDPEVHLADGEADYREDGERQDEHRQVMRGEFDEVLPVDHGAPLRTSHITVWPRRAPIDAAGHKC